eukprot:1147352-Amphidinium_carterae.1
MASDCVCPLAFCGGGGERDLGGCLLCMFLGMATLQSHSALFAALSNANGAGLVHWLALLSRLLLDVL